MSKKVLLVTDVMERGGVDRYLTDLALYTMREGWKVEVVLEQGTASVIPQLLNKSCPIHWGPLYHRHHSSGEVRAFFTSLLQKLRPELVHVSCGAPWSCLAVREEVLRAKVPLQFTEHLVPLHSFLEKERIQQIYQGGTAIHVSEEGLKNLSEQVSIPMERVQVIHNGVDILGIQQRSLSREERRKQLEEPRGSFRLLVASRIVAQKGVDLVIQALSLLPQQERQKLQLDIWGEGEERAFLEQKVEEWGLSACVAFHPWATTVVDLFVGYDLFLFPSRHEGLPFTLLEALASGIPVLASDIPVHRQITHQGKGACLFQAGSAIDLSRKLGGWLQKPQLDFERDWLQREFDGEKNLQKTVQVWEQLCDRA